MTQDEYEQKKEALIEEIERAFDGISREDGVTWHEARVIDDLGSDEERAEARAKDNETRWQDVSREDMNSMWDSYVFLDPKGFHYYFPAILVWYLSAMDGGPEMQSDAFDIIHSSLIPSPYHRNIQEFYIERFKMFNKEQSQAIAHFLEFERELLRWWWDQLEPHVEAANYAARKKTELDDPDEAYQRALDRYWGHFL